MKKSILTVAVAALALAGCTKNETVAVADSNVIGFNAFVGNATRAVTDVTTDNIKAFYAFGTKTDDANFISNIEVYESGDPNTWIYDGRYLWEESQNYTFAAYSNGGERGAKIDGAAWSDGNLTIADYDAKTEAKDLLVARASNEADVNATNAPVQFNFQHALAMIKFTLKSELGDGDNAITISNLTVKGINSTADLTFNTTDGIVWANWETPQDLQAEKFTTTSSEAGSSEPFVVIPGEANIGFTVEFDATFVDDEEGTTTQHLKATLSNQTFTAGYRYNYVATITGADMNVITFAKPEVTPWTDTDVNITDLK